MKLVSSDFYTELAPHYRDYVSGRVNYLWGIDKLILATLGGDSILDVGAGDGIRSVELSKMSGIDNVVLVEPNKAMAELCRKNTGLEVIETGAERLWGVPGEYDNVFCLYNVLGHVNDESSRAVALKNMGNKLAPEGSIYLDVNNRYNFRAYGLNTIKGNLMMDLVSKDNSHGDVSFSINVGGKNINASGHVFSPGEMENLINEAGLKIRKKVFVNYDTGKKALTSFSGQMFFELGNND